MTSITLPLRITIIATTNYVTFGEDQLAVTTLARALTTDCGSYVVDVTSNNRAYSQRFTYSVKFGHKLALLRYQYIDNGDETTVDIVDDKLHVYSPATPDELVWRLKMAMNNSPYEFSIPLVYYQN